MKPLLATPSLQEDPVPTWDMADLRAAFLSDVYAYAFRRLGRREEAEDVAAETFQAALGQPSRRRPDETKLWLLGIARRKTADALRRRRRRRETSLPDVLASGQSPERDFQMAESVRQIREIVLRLPDDQREALLLQHLEGLSIAEIAVVMGKRPTAVNSLLQRARARAYREGRAYFTDPEVQP